MRRLTTALTADEFGRAALNLGRVDENAAVRVEIDLSAILAQEPSASAHLTVESPSGAKYPASTVMDGGKLIWDVSDADTAAEGTGRAQLTVTGPGGEVLKSAVAVTRVGHSLRGEGEAPEPLKSWVDDAVAKLAAVENAIADAQQVADDIRQKLESGAFVGPKGDKGDPGPKGDPGDLSGLTKAAVVAALGYTPTEPHEFELIEEITLDEDVRNISRSTFPDGTPYNLRSVIVVIDTASLENRQTAWGWLRLNAQKPFDQWLYASQGTISDASTGYAVFAFRERADKTFESIYYGTVNSANTSYSEDVRLIPSNTVRFGARVTDIYLYTTDGTIPAGAKISIYGVRA